MPAIYLIRHGQASFGHDDYDNLSELGLQQASILGTALSARLSGFDVVACGTMRRHEQTAKGCLSELDSGFNEGALLFDSAWNEYDHQNILAQYDERFESATSTQAYLKTLDNPAQAFEQAFNEAVFQWMRGEGDYVESWDAFRSRVRGGLQGLVDNHNDAKTIAAFTSGGPISLLSQALLGVDEKHLMQLNWTLVNCGITKVVATSSRSFVSTLNEHVHFEGANRQFITYK